MNKHFPCGHWHKKKPSTAYAEILGIAPQYNGDEIDDTKNGIGLALYDITNNVWSLGGVSLGGSPSRGVPNTLRINKTYSCYYGPWDTEFSTYMFMRLHVFENGVVKTHDLWSYDANNKFLSTTSVYNTMDCNDSGMVVCIAYIQTEAGETKNAWAVKVSTTKGDTWSAIYYFPQVASTSYGTVRIDDFGNIWIMMSESTAKKFYIYKSSNYGASWSLTHTETLSFSPAYFDYSIDTTGKYQYAIYQVSGSVDKYFCISNDYGETWTISQLSSNSWGTNFVSHQDMVTIGYYPGINVFKVSSDYGASFADVSPVTSITNYYTDMQNCADNIIYTECGSKFGGATLGGLYSLDGGLTWRVVNIPSTPVFSNKVFTDGYQQSVDITT